MPTINLRDFYPFYKQDTFIEVSDEVAAELAEAQRLERNYMRRVFYNKSQYSIDADDGIEASTIVCYNDSPERVFSLMERHCSLCRALNSLPETQGRRIEAHYILGQSQRAIAKMEGVSINSVSLSIRRGLKAMKNFLRKF